jgi:hypothetical protein
MRQNWDGPVGPVTLKSAHGHVWAFPNLFEAAVFLARSGHHVLDVPEDPCLGPVPKPWGRFGVIVLDECGLQVPLWRVEEAGQGAQAPLRSIRPWARGPNAYDHERDFRKVPVAGVSRRRWGRFYRRVRTQGELRDLAGLETDLRDLEEFPVRVKIRGRRKTLPTAWDDIMVSGKGRGWKHHRRTQWK